MRKNRAIGYALTQAVGWYDALLSLEKRLGNGDKSDRAFVQVQIEAFTVEERESQLQHMFWPSVKKHREQALESAREYIRMINELRQVK